MLSLRIAIFLTGVSASAVAGMILLLWDAMQAWKPDARKRIDLPTRAR